MNPPEVLVMIAQLVLALSILVFIHELGHFLAAKAFGIRVEKFYIFFDAGGKKLFSFKWGETEYGMGWLPLGGYVKIVGMIDESMDKEQLKEAPKPFEFRSKPNWQKFIVMVAGVVMNVILGVLITAMVLFRYDQQYHTTESVNQDGVYALSTGQAYGLRTGDKLLSINGKEFERYRDFEAPMRSAFGAAILVERDGREVSVEIPSSYFDSVRLGKRLFEPFNEVYVDSVIEDPSTTRLAYLAGMQEDDQIIAAGGKPIRAYGEFGDHLRANKGKSTTFTVLRDGKEIELFTEVSPEGRLGFYPYTKIPDADSVAYTAGSAFRYGMADAWGALIFNARSLGKLVTGAIPAHGSIESPIGIAQLYGGVWNWERFWSLTALLSMVLAFMNILPIPALDGGHIMFILIETISGRKLSDAFMEKAQITGMIIILALMLFAFGSDIVEIFQRS